MRRLKSILRYRRLAPPPRWRDGLAAVGVAAAGLLEALDERLLRLGLRDLGEVGVRRRSADRGSWAWACESASAQSSRPCRPWKIGIVSPARTCTIAFFHARVRPACEPAALGLGLDRHRADLDDLDVEELLDGLADLRLVRVGVDAERVLVGGGEHVALLADDRADDDLAGDPCQASSLAVVAVGAVGERVERRPARRAARAAPIDVGDADVRRRAARETRSRLRNDSATCSSLVAEDDEHRAAGCRPVAEQLGGLLGRRRVDERRGSKTASEPRSACTRQRAAQRGAALLAVDLEGVVARLRAEDGAAAGPDRRARRAGAGAAGALLAPRLGAAAADLAAGLGRRACPGGARSSSARTDSWTSGPLNSRAEGGVVELRPSCVPPRIGASSHRCAPPRRRCAGRGRRRGRAAGSARRRPATTSRPFWVTRLLPIWPGPRMPFITRAGQAEAPIEPGARTLCEPWRLRAAAEVVALDRALEALALGDAGDLDLVAGLERLDGDGLADRAARRPRRGTPRGARAAAASAFFRWPSSALVRCFSLAAPKASCTAS